MARSVDYLAQASRSSRAEFAARHPTFFLVGASLLARPVPGHRTGVFKSLDDASESTGVTDRAELEAQAKRLATMLVLPVCKQQEQYPSMITVGRTANNDIVIPDINVSRFHAFFRVHPDRVELADTGSANGTFVAGKKLVPKGPPQTLVSGRRLAFAHLEFAFLDAGATWDRLRAVDLDV